MADLTEVPRELTVLEIRTLVSPQTDELIPLRAASRLVLLFWTYSSSYRACENLTLWSLMSASWLPLNLYFQGLVPLFTDLQTEDKCGF